MVSGLDEAWTGSGPGPRWELAKGVRRCFVCRTSGLPVERVQELRCVGVTRVAEALLLLEQRLRAMRHAASDALYEIVGRTVDKHTRYRLLRLRRDVFNLRDIDLRDVPELAAGRSLALQDFCNAIGERRRLAVEFEEVYAREVGIARRKARSVFEEPDFQNGLVLSSPTLYAALTKYREASPAHENGKWERTERGLLRYLTRAAMKATPFSTFCNVVPGWFEEGWQGNLPSAVLEGTFERKRSFVRLNKALCSTLMSHLRARPAVRARLPLELNSTIRHDDGFVMFLTTIGGRETFQRVRSSPLLEVLEELVIAEAGLSLEVLERRITEDPRIEITSKEDVGTYLNCLVEAGFLTLRTGVREQDPDWDLELCGMLESISDPDADVAANMLRKLRAILSEYSGAPASKRVGLLAEMRSAIAHAFAALGIRIPPDRALPMYEDATSSASLHIHEPNPPLRAFEKLGELVSLCSRVATPRADQAAMRHFFDTHYAPIAQSVALLTFYEDYYRNHYKKHIEQQLSASGRKEIESGRYDVRNPFGLPFVDSLYAAHGRLSQRVWALWRESPNAATIAISRDDIEDALRDVTPQGRVAKSATIFTQMLIPSSGTEELRLVVPLAHCLTGYGKYFSRFLYMLPPRITDETRKANQQLARHDRVAEICGDAHFNANLHPQLLQWEIRYPTTESRDDDSDIGVEDLRVERDSSDPNALALVHVQTGTRVFPVDLGFLSPRMRPPLYQLLAFFTPLTAFAMNLPDRLDSGPGQPEPAPSLERVGELPRREEGRIHGVTYRPRITYEDLIIVARRRWTVSSSMFPYPQRGEGEGQYFVRVHRWRQELGLPMEVYVKVRPLGVSAPGHAVDHPIEQATARERGSSDARPGESGIQHGTTQSSRRATIEWRDFHKPQYIDFASPLLVNAFSRLPTGLAAFDLILEERLPDEHQLVSNQGVHYTTEMVVQLDLPEACDVSDRTL